MPPDVHELQVPKIAAVEPDDAAVGIQQTGRQVRDGALADATAADQRQALTRPRRERHLVQHARLAIGTERDRLESHLAAALRQTARLGTLLHIDRRIQNLAHTRP